MTDSVENLMEHLAIDQDLKCCKQSMIPCDGGNFQCTDCKSVWKNNKGAWKDNILSCCGKNISVSASDDDCFYCDGCNKPRQVCVYCHWMFHTKHNFYHGICRNCCDIELEKGVTCWAKDNE